MIQILISDKDLAALEKAGIKYEPFDMDKAVDEELCKMIKGDPAQMILHLLIQMGKMCVEANAETMDIKTQSTFNNQRYDVKAKITTKKVKK